MIPRNFCRYFMENDVLLIPTICLFQTWPYSFQRADSSTDGSGERDTQMWGDLPIPAVVRDKDVSYYY